jgi:flagellar hook capping protein FlgD
MRTIRFSSLPPLTALLLTVLVPANVQAAWPHDPYNGNLAICTAPNEQTGPAIVPDGAGGAIMAWSDYRSLTNQDIYAQRVNAAGVPQWAANGVGVCTDTDFQTGAVVIEDGAGGVFIAWQTYISDYDVHAQHVNSAGVPQWTANGVLVCNAVGDQGGVSMVQDGAGGVILTWQDDRPGGYTHDIYSQRLNAAGAPQWAANGVALCTASGYQVNVGTVPDGAGGAIASWWDYRGADSDIYAQRVNGAGVPQWTADGVQVSTVPGEQIYPASVPDGAGGVIITWVDYRAGNADVYAQKMNGAGIQQWYFDDVPVCTATGGQEIPAIASDGAAGAIIAWFDQRGVFPDVYARRVNAGGTAMWTANGVQLATGGSYKGFPAIATDGAGGAIITWPDHRSGFHADAYAQRVSAGGARLWDADGAAVSAAAGDQTYIKVISDGASGAIATWADLRLGPSTSNADIYAQRIERFGQLGNPEPAIVQIKDVPNDQGGKVSIQWTASYLDAVPNNPVGEYWIWRQVPTAMALNALRRGEPLFEARGATVQPRVGALRATAVGAQVFYWEFVASSPAHGFAAYGYTASTTSDSVAAGNPYTRFMVEAEQTPTGYYWSSTPDSGYSVDNLPPTTPAPFTGEYGGGVATLHWNPNTESDIALYRLHRGTSPGFVPGPGNLVTSQSDTGYADNTAQLHYYKLAAMDSHGNLSGYALLLPQSTVGVSAGELPVEVALGPARPNPMSNGATFQLALPQERHVRLALFDQQGRLVRELVSGLVPAGVHAVSWDRCNRSGARVPSGVYFCRLEVGGRTLVRRLAAIH